MNIYKAIARDLKDVGATPMQAHLAFVALRSSGIRYLKYIEELRERREKRASVDEFVRERYGDAN